MSEKTQIPEDFNLVLEEHRRLRDGFFFLPLTAQREYVEWIESSITPEERERRIYETIEKLRDEVE